MKNFWQKLKQKKNKENKPIIALSPMADVTDVAFRQMFAKYGRPDVMWTEFVSADGLVMAPDDNKDSNNGISSKGKLLADLKFLKNEKPIVAQIFSSNQEHIKEVSRLCLDLGFDGIDINMGCPDRSIEKQGCGSAMIKNPKLAREIIKAAKEGSGGLPVSVKTRLGYNKDELETWLPELLAENPVVVTLHARTRKEMSKVPARWERIKRAVEIRDEIQKDLKKEERTLIFGNGDVMNLEEAHEKFKETGCDGVMIGRGIFGNPWVFTGYGKAPGYKVSEQDGIKQQLEALVEHTKLFEKHLSHKSMAIMKKHYKAYCEGFKEAKELRMKLMEAKNSEEISHIVGDFLKVLKK